MILIDENGDLVVKVTEWSTDVESGERSISGVEEFRVRRRTIANAAPSWRKMLTGNNWAEAAQDTVEFRDDPIRGMEILFRVLHNAVTDDTYEATITEVW